MAGRRYTAFDGNAPRRRAGTEEMIKIVNQLSEGGLWNNGSWGPRMKRGKSSPSIHGTGRACDLSWRGGKYGGFGDYAKAKEWIDFFTKHAAALQIEMILDYYPSPFGTGYKCDRDYTIKYKTKTIKGAPGGDWFHVEVAPAVADDASFFAAKLPQLWKGGGGSVPQPEEEEIVELPGPEDYPGHEIGLKHEHKDEVRLIQTALAVGVGGDFGTKTQAAVTAFRSKNQLPAGGEVDDAAWRILFGMPQGSDTTKVEAGEGWSQIAARALGDGSRWAEIAGLNGGKDRVLHPGDNVMLPTSKQQSGKTTTVQAGDGWWPIAARELGDGSRWTELAALNGGEDRVLQPGDELTLP